MVFEVVATCRILAVDGEDTVNGAITKNAILKSPSTLNVFASIDFPPICGLLFPFIKNPSFNLNFETGTKTFLP